MPEDDEEFFKQMANSSSFTAGQLKAFSKVVKSSYEQMKAEYAKQRSSEKQAWKDDHVIFNLINVHVDELKRSDFDIRSAATAANVAIRNMLDSDND